MFLLNGLYDLPWWGYGLIVIASGQLTFAAISLYLHRSQAHLSLQLHPIVSHFFRFWLWLTTGMKTKSWVAIHRKHHAKCETEEDPHSPRIYGIKEVLFRGAELYRKEEDNQATLDNYGHGTPTDWVERNIYGRGWNTSGVALLLLLDIVLFGVMGVAVWALQMLWTPFHAAGVINGIGHYWGYRNYESTDDATNISPLAFWIAGEELHNNHHAYPSSAKFSIKPWEFDIGWLYIRVLQAVGLARVKKVAPQPVIDKNKQHLDMESVKAIVRSKMHVMANYANSVIKPVLQQECAHLEDTSSRMLRKAKNALILEKSRLQEKHKSQLHAALQSNQTVHAVYDFRQQLQTIWNSTYASQEKLLHALSDWCHRAEASGIAALQEFAASLKGYSLRTA